MTRLRRVAGLALLLLSPIAHAYELSEVVTNMTAAEQSFKSISFAFDQDVTFATMQSSSTVSGRALFAQPNKMRIEKLTPEKQLTVSNGKSLWIYNPAFNQVWQGTWKGWVGSKAVPEGLVPLGGYMADLQKRFNLALAEDRTGAVHLIAKPKDAAQGYELELFVSTASWLPVRTVYRSDSAVVVTRLRDVALNPAGAANDFQFKAPKGADVIPLN